MVFNTANRRKGGLTRNDLYGAICMTLSGFKISSYKSEEMELILSFKNRIIQILTPRKKVLPDYFFTSQKVLPQYLLPMEKVLPLGKKCSPILKFWLHVSCNTL